MPTGPGGLDSNGIWQFGEDDSEALASDLLNLGMGSVSDAFTNLAGVLQVVSTTKTDTFSTTSTSLTDVTGLAATITPVATSSRIRVTVSVPHGHSNTTGNIVLVLRDGSDNPILNPTSPGNRSESFFAGLFGYTSVMGVSSFTFVHSPSTTSAFTYKVSCLTAGGTFFVNRSGDDSNVKQFGRGVATVTLTEVAG